MSREKISFPLSVVKVYRDCADREYAAEFAQFNSSEELGAWRLSNTLTDCKRPKARKIKALPIGRVVDTVKNMRLAKLERACRLIETSGLGEQSPSIFTLAAS